MLWTKVKLKRDDDKIHEFLVLKKENIREFSEEVRLNALTKPLLISFNQDEIIIRYDIDKVQKISVGSIIVKHKIGDSYKRGGYHVVSPKDFFERYSKVKEGE